MSALGAKSSRSISSPSGYSPLSIHPEEHEMKGLGNSPLESSHRHSRWDKDGPGGAGISRRATRDFQKRYGDGTKTSFSFPPFLYCTSCPNINTSIFSSTTTMAIFSKSQRAADAFWPDEWRCPVPLGTKTLSKKTVFPLALENLAEMVREFRTFRSHAVDILPVWAGQNFGQSGEAVVQCFIYRTLLDIGAESCCMCCGLYPLTQLCKGIRCMEFVQTTIDWDIWSDWSCIELMIWCLWLGRIQGNGINS